MLGSSLFATHAYHKLPTGTKTRNVNNIKLILETYTSSEFIDRSQHRLYNIFLSKVPLSYETFRLEPATRQFDWSFAPTSISCQRVEHQYDLDPPSGFTPTSIKTDVVHYLSGLTVMTSIISCGYCCNICIHLAITEISLGRVSIRVQITWLNLLYFHFSSSKRSFFNVRSPYLNSLSVFNIYLALGITTSYLPTALPSSSILPI